MWSCNQNRSELLCEYMLLMGAGGQGPQAREDTAQRILHSEEEAPHVDLQIEPQQQASLSEFQHQIKQWAVKTMQEGKVPKLEKILEDSDSEEEAPDVELQIPAHKVKLIIGAGGEKIKWIQRKTKCRIQASGVSRAVVETVEEARCWLVVCVTSLAPEGLLAFHCVAPVEI